MELIDRDMLKEVVEDNDEAISDDIHRWGRGMFTENIHKVIDAQPTVDAEPIRHGCWNTRDTMKGGYEYLTCECGKRHTVRKPYTTTVNTCSICGWSEWVSVQPYKYCPECGAKMDAERREG